MERNETKRGFFVTFEGPEGAGKTTQINFLHQAFDERAIASVITREPGGTEVAERLRDIVKHHVGEEPISDEAELLLFAASRSQHVRNLIMPNLAKGVNVLCDRFYDSTTAYQGYGRRQDLDFIKRLNNYAICGCVPDLTILMDLPPEEGFKRTILRQARLFDEVEDRIEGEAIEFHHRVRDGYLRVAAEEPERVKVVPANLPPELVREKIWSLIEDAFGPI